MNILGYISAILILIGIAFNGYYFSWFSDQKLHDSLKGYHDAFRNLKKEFVKETFKSIPAKNKYKSMGKSPKDTQQKSCPLKKELTPYCMRLNLGIYKDIDLSSNFDLTVLEKLLALLYQDKLINTKNISAFSQNLVAAIQAKKSEIIHLEQLKFKNPKDQEIYYKMLKGKEGFYPSFLNYVTINSDLNPKICVACADVVMLTSLFNKKITDTLLLAKQNPLEQNEIDKSSFDKLLSYHDIKKECLPKLLLKHVKSNVKEVTITTKEEMSKIQLNQKMPFNFKNAKKNNLAKKS